MEVHLRCFRQTKGIRVKYGNMPEGFYEGAVRFRKQSCREIAITN